MKKYSNSGIIGFICVLMLVISLLIHQINALFQIAYIYFALCEFLWGIFYIFVGVKQLHQERLDGRNLRWNQNFSILVGMIIALPSFGLITHTSSIDLIGHTGVVFIDLIEIIVVSVFLVFLLFFEVVLTVGFIRTLLKHADPSKKETSEQSPREKL